MVSSQSKQRLSSYPTEPKGTSQLCNDQLKTIGKYYPCGSLFCTTFLAQAVHTPLALNNLTSTSRSSPSQSHGQGWMACVSCAQDASGKGERVSHRQNHSSLGASHAATHVKLQRSAHTLKKPLKETCLLTYSLLCIIQCLCHALK
jgi:hypothetical protein